MPLIGLSCEFGALPNDRNLAVLTDGDNTLFKRGTNQLYPDSANRLDGLRVHSITLVSANPDDDLASARRGAIENLVDRGTLTAEVHPSRPVLNKYRLYEQAIRQLPDMPESILVQGDRWMFDVIAGKLAACRLLGEPATGICVRRPGCNGDIWTDKAISPIEKFVWAAAKKILPGVADRLIAEN